MPVKPPAPPASAALRFPPSPFGFQDYCTSGRPVKPSSYAPPPFIAPDPAVLPGSFLHRVLQFSWEGGLPVPHLSMYLYTMSKYHDRWYTRLFGDPLVVEDLLRSFVHEGFVQLLDFEAQHEARSPFRKIPPLRTAPRKTSRRIARSLFRCFQPSSRTRARSLSRLSSSE